jgi:hypothetical protein
MSEDQYSPTSPTSESQFPLNDIDYESSPAAVAQELSNLQAIRRMSMEVNGMDPDLPHLNQPTLGPSHGSDDQDPSRLFWVPASVHPELAPNQFKSFIQERVKTLRRSSLSEQPLSPDAPQKANGGVGSSSSSGGGLSASSSLQRRKSMLSRQIDNANGYEDGATILERKRSQASAAQPHQINLQELEDLMNDPSLVRQSFESGESPDSGDMPILPAKPAGQGLRRSTRTQYRRGSLKKAGLSRRQTLDQEEPNPNKAPQLPNVPQVADLSFSELANGTFGLTRVQTEPLPSNKSIENFSRPGRRQATSPTPSQTSFTFDEPSPPIHTSPSSRHTADPQPIPQIIEPNSEQEPFMPDPISRASTLPTRTPERSSSIDQQPPKTSPDLASRPVSRPQPLRPQSSPQRIPPTNHQPANITLDDITGANVLPGNTRSDTLSIIPTYPDEGKKPEKKKSKEEKKSGWAWFSSSSNEDKEREKREKEEAAKKKSKPKPHESARLDVLQSSIDGTRSRESTVFDRHSLTLPEEEQRKPSRKTSGESKREKDGIFSTLFGTSKRRDKESKSKHSSGNRGLSPDPPYRILRADVDYNWTRFSILEERAIYRLAHIKLANPRRELYSQVLLSNFMYSYLAKVQQMHPQVQMHASAQKQVQQRQQQQAQAEREKQEKRERMLEEERKMRQAYAERQAQLQDGGSRDRDSDQSGGLGNAAGDEEYAQYRRYQEVSFKYQNKIGL